MKIYTKKGDSGFTNLFGGEVISKTSSRIEAYGSLDELNSYLGICYTKIFNIYPKCEFIKDIQSKLFIIGAQFSNYRKEKVILESDILEIEKLIDEFDLLNPPLKNFILPGGSEISSMLHYARSIARRAERVSWAMVKEYMINLNFDQHYKNSLIYLNRLSDFLFVIARFFNYKLGVEEIIWKNENRKL